MDRLVISATQHGVNYLPEYYAAAQGWFEELGLTVAAEPRDPWTGVLDDLADGSADLALGGLWGPAMYAGMGRDLVAVGQLNARFPMAVVTREPVEGFEWRLAQGRRVATGWYFDYEAKRLPSEPEFIEWLILLDRGDLI